MTRLAPTRALAPGWNREGQRPWPGSLEQHAGRELFVRRTPVEPDGSLPPAVFVHGLGGSALNWTDLMALLRGRFAGVAPDLPGFGYSLPSPDRDYSVDAFVSAVGDVVEHEVARSGRPVALFGNSLGGAVCVRLAARRPDLVDTLVLVSPALPDFRPHPGVVLVPVLALPRLGEGLFRQMQRMPPERQVQAMLETNFGDPSSLPHRRRQEVVEEYRRRMALPYAGEALSAAARGLLKAFADPSASGLWREAGSLVAPTLLVYGGRDRLVNVRRVRRAAAVVPHAHAVVLPHVGHMAQVEAPQTLARFVLGFVDAAPHQSVASPT